MVLTHYVKGVKGQSYGTMLDHYSTDHYVTLDMVEKYKLYKVPIKDTFGAVHVLDCYGLAVIASAAEPAGEQRVGIKSGKVRRPRRMDLLLSMRAALLLP